MKIEIMDMRMDLPIRMAVKVKFYSLVLLFRRGKRFISRFMNYIKSLSVVFICLILYVVMVYIWGKNFKDLSLQDILWESKTVLFTSLFVTFSVNLFSGEKSRKELLLSRHEYYSDVLWRMDSDIKHLSEYLGIEEFQELMLYTHSSYLILKKQIEDAKNMDTVYENIRINKKILIKEYDILRKDIISIKKEMRDLYLNKEDRNSINYNIRECLKGLDNIEKVLEMDISNEDYIKEYSQIVYYIYAIIDEIRKPWRLDVDITNKIYKVLDDENKVNFLEHYYISKVLDEAA